MGQVTDEDVEGEGPQLGGSEPGSGVIGRTPWQIFWKIRMPNALPYIFSGMKISITLAIIGVIVSEFVASQEGIGYLIKLAGGLLDTPLMMAAITVLSISGLALYGLIVLAEQRSVYWQSSSDISSSTGG